MVVWAIVAGTLIGLGLGGWSGYGAAFGAILGAIMGLWLRAAIRAEIAHAAATPVPSRQIATPEPETRHAEDLPFAQSEAWAKAQPLPIHEDNIASRDNIGQSEPPAPHFASPANTAQPTEPSLIEQGLGKAREWLLGGNTIVRVGLVILFVGLSFLARMAAHFGLFPIEARLALVALAGAGLLAVGFNRREVRPAFGLALQGTGVGVLYLTVFAAARILGLMPPLAAFGLMVVFAALGCALALLQNARSLAFASFLGGYGVPLLLGGHAHSPIGLFAYFTILNLALLVIARARSWRELNLLGFIATFGTATLWGLASYGPQNYLVCQIFLWVSVAIYLAAAVFYAHNTPGKLGNVADTTLLFGPAMAGFALEVGLVHDRAMGSAFAALAFAALYLCVATYTMRQARAEMRLLNECLLAIGIGFVTMAVPLALDARWTSSAWALEGAGAFWVGARQARWMPRAFGLALQAIAGLILLATLSANVSAIPLANNGFIGPALVAAALIATAWWMRAARPHSGSALAKAYAPAEYALRHAVFLAGFAMASLALIQEIARQLPATQAQDYPLSVFAPWQQVLLGMLALIGAAAVAEWFGRRRAWAVAIWPARAILPLLWLTFIASVAQGRHVVFWPDMAAWGACLVAHYALLRRADIAGEVPGWSRAVHAGGAWLITMIVADSLYLGIERGQLWHSSWVSVVFLISVVAILAGLTRWSGPAAPLAQTQGLGWPRHPAARAYWWIAAAPLAVLAYIGAFAAALFAEGLTDPLPYLPLINPVDLSVALALVTLIVWRRMLAGAHDIPPLAKPLLGKAGLMAGGALAFASLNGVWLRTAHHWLGAGWSGQALGQNAVVEAGLSILWTLIAMALMLFAHRRALRVSWLVGAGLLAAVVAKLLLVDMSKAQGWERATTFIGVGLLMLVIGYFVPLPPRPNLRTPEETPA